VNNKLALNVFFFFFLLQEEKITQSQTSTHSSHTHTHTHSLSLSLSDSPCSSELNRPTPLLTMAAQILGLHCSSCDTHQPPPPQRNRPRSGKSMGELGSRSKMEGDGGLE
jgi:hypothetical protein